MPCFNASVAPIGSPHGAHLEGLGDTSQPRKSLGSASPGNDAELHFRLTHLRRRDRNAVVAAHRGFEPAAEPCP